MYTCLIPLGNHENTGCCPPNWKHGKREKLCDSVELVEWQNSPYYWGDDQASRGSSGNQMAGYTLCCNLVTENQKHVSTADLCIAFHCMESTKRMAGRLFRHFFKLTCSLIGKSDSIINHIFIWFESHDGSAIIRIKFRNWKSFSATESVDWSLAVLEFNTCQKLLLLNDIIQFSAYRTWGE